jgi:surface polysaccharide O-acyltransferase-like enzyme
MPPIPTTEPNTQPGSSEVLVHPSLAWVDAARVLAILAVIAIHTASSLVSNRALPESWWFGNLVQSAARWSVPMFVMISGALLLRSPSADDPISFYRRRLSRILPPLIAWSAIYLLYGHVNADNPRTLNDAVSLLLAGRPYFHLYFLFLITGLYFVAPFLRPLVALPDRRTLGLAVLVFLALGMVDDIITIQWHYGGANAATRFVPYVGYFLAGAWLSGLTPTRSWIVAAASVAGVGILATAVGTYLLLESFGFTKGFYLYEYLSVATVPTSLAVFALFAWSAPLMDRFAARLPHHALSIAAASTLGIYVLHPLVIQGLGVFGFGARSFFVPLAVPASILATFLISLVVVLAMRQVPGVRRIV